MTSDRYDVVIVGGGPAGLSAALVLGRSCRKVLVVDAGNPRNARSLAMHGYLSRDGMNPAEFLKLAREEIKCYGVAFCEGTAMGADPKDGGFEVILLDGSRLRSRKLLLATGVIDRIPQIDGLDQFYGKSAHHCPYCDGWEQKDAPIAVYGHGRPGAGLALAMLNWSRDVVLCTDGHTKISPSDREQLARNSVEIYDQRIARVEGTASQLEKIVFADNTSIARHAIFFNTGNVQRSALPKECGCETTQKGAVRTSRGQRSSVRGIWVCGDASEDTQYVVVAAAEGAKAAMGINQELQIEDQR